MNLYVTLLVIVGVENMRIIIEVVFSQIATLDTSPDGVFLDVEYAVDTGNILPSGIGTEFYLARADKCSKHQNEK